MPRRSLHLRQRPASSKRVADEGMAPVMDGQRAEAIPAQDAAGRVEAAPQDVAIGCSC